MRRTLDQHIYSLSTLIELPSPKPGSADEWPLLAHATASYLDTSEGPIFVDPEHLDELHEELRERPDVAHPTPPPRYTSRSRTSSRNNTLARGAAPSSTTSAPPAAARQQPQHQSDAPTRLPRSVSGDDGWQPPADSEDYESVPLAPLSEPPLGTRREDVRSIGDE